MATRPRLEHIPQINICGLSKLPIKLKAAKLLRPRMSVRCLFRSAISEFVHRIAWASPSLDLYLTLVFSLGQCAALLCSGALVCSMDGQVHQ